MLSPQQAHDDYLELSASAGIVGVGLFVWFVVALLQTARKALDSFTGIQRVFAIGAIVGILGVCVHSLIDFGLHITANALVFVMLLALLSLKPINQRPRAQEHRNAAFS
jgi:O-antigen ligase